MARTKPEPMRLVTATRRRQVVSQGSMAPPSSTATNLPSYDDASMTGMDLEPRSSPRPDAPDVRPALDGGLQPSSAPVDASGDMPSATPKLQASRTSGSASPVTNGIETVGRGVKELVQAIKELEKLGVDAEVSLPKIVVVGDQSAGKSSLIEAISEIKVPRSSGTCTRCPLQITLTTAEDPNAAWRCSIELHRKFVYVPQSQPSGEHETRYRWTRYHSLTITPFKELQHKDDVPDFLHRAQVAILNPGEENLLRFTTDPVGPISDTSQLQVPFSPNLVCLNITAPGLPNLSFYDLPGVINQTEDEASEHLVEMVRDMVREYITPDNVLVLIAVSLENDVHNSSAAGLVRKARAENRSIGVLTKPDRLPADYPTSLIRDILRGDKFALGHGYFVTKQLSQNELDMGLSHIDARKSEDIFFRITDPWARDLAQFQGQFGTKNLQKILSEKLAIQILSCLPSIRQQIQKRLGRIETQLAMLPDPPTTNALSVVIETLGTFTSGIQQQMEQPDASSFKPQWKLLRSKFFDQVQKLQPKLVVRAPADALQAKSLMEKQQGEAIIIDDDEDEEMAPQPVTPAKKLKRANGSGVPSPNPPSSTPTPRRKQASTSGSETSDEAVRFQLEDLRRRLQDSCTSDVPDQWDASAVDMLILVTLAKWHKPMTEFLDATESLLKATLEKELKAAFEAWDTTELFRKVKKIVGDFVCTHMSYVRDVIANNALKNERCRPLTNATETMKEYRLRELARLEKARADSRLGTFYRVEVEAGKASSEAEKRRRNGTVLDLLGPDPFQREVEVVAQVRAYYSIASVRFSDVVCLSMVTELFEKFRKDRNDASQRNVFAMELNDQLGVYQEDGHQRCMECLADDPRREVRRHQLKTLRQQLITAQACLDELARKHPGSTDPNPMNNPSIPLRNLKAYVEDFDDDVDDDDENNLI